MADHLLAARAHDSMHTGGLPRHVLRTFTFLTAVILAAAVSAGLGAAALADGGTCAGYDTKVDTGSDHGSATYDVVAGDDVIGTITWDNDAEPELASWSVADGYTLSVCVKGGDAFSTATAQSGTLSPPLQDNGQSPAVSHIAWTVNAPADEPTEEPTEEPTQAPSEPAGEPTEPASEEPEPEPTETLTEPAPTEAAEEPTDPATEEPVLTPTEPGERETEGFVDTPDTTGSPEFGGGGGPSVDAGTGTTRRPSVTRDVGETSQPSPRELAATGLPTADVAVLAVLLFVLGATIVTTTTPAPARPAPWLVDPR